MSHPAARDGASRRRGAAARLGLAAALAVGVAVIVACGSGREPRDSGTPPAGTAAAPAVAAPAVPPPDTVTAGDSVVMMTPFGRQPTTADWTRLLALHDSTLAPGADVPRLLWEAGSLAIARLPAFDRDAADTLAARRMPGAYAYDEISGMHLYTGSHLRELVRRFPAHARADDAAWALALLPGGGECEGFFACYLSRSIDPLSGFMLAFPRSEYAAVAVDSADRHMRLLFAELDSGGVEFDSLPVPPATGPSHDTQVVDSTMAQYGHAVDGLPEPLRADARRRLAPFVARWRERRRG